MKLLFVHDERVKFDNEGNCYTGGAYNNEVWKRYKQFSDSFTVLLRKDNKIYKSNFSKNKFNSFDTEGINLVVVENLFDSIKSYLSFTKRKSLKDNIRKQVQKCDLLIVRLPSKNGSEAVKYAKRYNKPFLVEMVGCPWDALWNHSFKGKVRALFSYLITKKCVKYASHVLYVTNEFLQRRYPTKGKSIGCSDVSISSIDDEVLEKRIRKINAMDANKSIILGTVGAVDVRYKGQEYIIEAISILNKEGFNFEYYLVGGGDTDYLKSVAVKNNVLDKVKFLGALPHTEVFNFLDKIDIYIQPSKVEGLPRALVEAMSRACPALGTRIGGIPELLPSDSLFKKAAVNEICDKLRKLDKALLSKSAKNNFLKAKEFDKDVLEEKRVRFYKEFIKGNL